MGTGQRLGYRPSLDGLRAVAVVAVMLHHTDLYDVLPLQPHLGGTGVSMFFTLSGFLITWLVLDEQDGGRLDLRAFWGRRVRRLAPALAVYAAVMATIGWAGGEPVGRDLLLTGTYTANWWAAAGGTIGIGHHVWSLSIEEQFYLVWPLVMAYAARPARWGAAVAVGSVALAALLWTSGAGWDRIYYGSDTRAVSLLAGCLLAFAARRGKVSGSVPIGAGLLVVAAAGLVPLPVRLLLEAGGTCLVIGALLQRPSRALSSRGAVWVGRRSYALYLWHVPVFGYAATVAGPWWLRWPAATAVAVGLAGASWVLVERRWLQHRRAPVPRAVPATAAS